MTVKEQVLKVLELNKGKSISGEGIAQEIGVSRAAVWKAINTLKEQGYPISAVTNKGYCLNSFSNTLSHEGIFVNLKTPCIKENLTFFPTTNSTNTQGKAAALNGATHGSLFVAAEQTQGKGRFGRSFFSPKEGIYLSMLFKPDSNLAISPALITIGAAVAICNTIERLTNLKPQIKWVNDVYINGKKICGILTEAVTDFETQTIQNVVVGIGVNFKGDPALVPEELKDIVGFLFTGDKETPVDRNQFAAFLAEELFSIWNQLEEKSFLQSYRERSFLIGKEIWYQKGEEKITATVCSIDDDGGLVVLPKNSHQQVVLNSGEVSVKPI